MIQAPSMRALSFAAILAAASHGFAQPAEVSGAKAPAAAAAAATSATAMAAIPLGVVLSPKEIKPLKVGDALPRLAPLKDAKGELVTLADAVRGKTAVIVFYRGGWCPYCNTHLSDLARIQPQLAAKGIELIGISPDKPEELAKTATKDNLPYTLLSDSDKKAAVAFGLAFAVDEATLVRYKGFGIDLAAASGNPDAVLPVPSVFVVDAEGKLTFAYTNPEYKVRLSGEEVLKAAGVK
jgi:peroxiredoxin